MSQPLEVRILWLYQLQDTTAPVVVRRSEQGPGRWVQVLPANMLCIYIYTYS